MDIVALCQCLNPITATPCAHFIGLLLLWCHDGRVTMLGLSRGRKGAVIGPCSAFFDRDPWATCFGCSFVNMCIVQRYYLLVGR